MFQEHAYQVRVAKWLHDLVKNDIHVLSRDALTEMLTFCDDPDMAQNQFASLIREEITVLKVSFCYLSPFSFFVLTLRANFLSLLRNFNGEFLSLSSNWVPIIRLLIALRRPMILSLPSS
jgi:hypothetical protein